MKFRPYWLIRNLHLYFGLFISPFVLVFAVSVFFMVHASLSRLSSGAASTRVATVLDLPENLSALSGRAQIDALRPVMEALNVPGEIGFVRRLVKEEKLVVPVSMPGRATTVEIGLTNHMATIVTRETGLVNAFVTLHRSPGPHAPTLEMNWVYIKIWRWFADLTAYVILFVTLSGIYLWYVLRHERKAGYLLLLAGTVTFFGLTYVLGY